MDELFIRVSVRVIEVLSSFANNSVSIFLYILYHFYMFEKGENLLKSGSLSFIRNF